MRVAAPTGGFRFVPAIVVSLASAAAIILTGCAGQVGAEDSIESNIQRGALVSAAEHHDLSAPLTLMQPAALTATNVEHPVKKIPRHYSRARPFDPVLQSAVAVPLVAPAPLTNFNGVGNGFSGPAGTFSVAAAPPDTNGDVGPNHYVQIVNTDFAIFNKSGTAIFGPVAINTLWSGFGGGCQTNNDGDPVVVYDPIADRWVISQFSVTTTPNLQCVAVSQTADPTGAYFRYSFTYTDFPDYPKMGVWPDAYYITFNSFAGGTTFNGSRVCAYDRTRMLTGAAATQQCFQTSTAFGGLLPSDLDGARQPPVGSPNYVVGLGAAAGQLAYWKFHVDWTTPANTTFTGPTTLTTAAFAEACAGGTCIPQSGTAQQLDSLADRLMFRLAYRNFGDHEALVTNHSITAGSSTGVRWYELRPDAGHNLSIFQQGTYAPDANFRWMGSLAFDQSGNIALGFSVSSSALHPEIHYTGRLAGDAAGTMTQGEGTIINGAGSQTGSSLSRWGDYSNMVVDPVDDCTFWYTTEYIPANGAFNWSTRIGSFKFPGCGGVVANDFSISASPTTVTVTSGGSGTSTISTAVTSGAAQSVNLTASGVPAGASASFNPTPVTAGGSSTLTLSSGTAAPGTYTITVTGTGASATHSTTVTFVVNAVVANDFSINASPANVSVTSGGSGTSTISTAVTSGAAQTVNLSASGLPTGATASFAPTSVTAGGSSTLTLSSGTAAVGTYTVTVTGTGTSATHSTTVTFVIRAVVANDFSISANPTSVSVTAGGSGNSNISTAVTSGAAQTVTLSASGVPTGATATFAPTSVTAGGSSTLTLSSGSAAAGTYTITVTGAGTSATHSTTVTFVINAVVANDFSISASPTSLTLASGGSGTSTISTAVTSGAAQSVALSASGVPTGATASFSPASVTAGGSSTLTINTGTAAAGSYTVTVTGTGTSATHSTSIALTVTATTGAGITNGGFETGTLAGWTSAGSTSVVNTGAHGGTFAARVGSTVPTNGDSSIAQTFTATAGSTGLSFFYKVTCPDTLQFDWATATLRDNTTATTTTILAKTCTNNNTYVQVTSAITAAHSYTLTLTSHDDNFSGDPTFTLFDDVTLTNSAPPPPPPPSAIVNGGFETGSLSGWTATGASNSVVSSGCHGGSFCARSGSTAPTNGDSSIAQTFTAPSGGTTVSFWYSNTCPDTLQFDWATATLRDNTTATTTTILPKTCAASAAFTQVSAAITAGHSYTLTLTSHDDNFGADPTFTIFDDVATQ